MAVDELRGDDEGESGNQQRDQPFEHALDQMQGALERTYHLEEMHMRSTNPAGETLPSYGLHAP